MRARPDSMRNRNTARPFLLPSARVSARAVIFPEGTTVNQKGILVGSAMLIDFRYFEKQKEG